MTMMNILVMMMMMTITKCKCDDNDKKDVWGRCYVPSYGNCCANYTDCVSCFRCIDTVVEIMSDILQKLVWAEEHPNFGAATDL